MVYSTDILGVEEFIDFMYRNKYLQKTYTVDEIMWEQENEK